MKNFHTNSDINAPAVSIAGKKMFGEAFGAATEVSDPGYKRSEYETTAQAARPPL